MQITVAFMGLFCRVPLFVVSMTANRYICLPNKSRPDCNKAHTHTQTHTRSPQLKYQFEQFDIELLGKSTERNQVLKKSEIFIFIEVNSLQIGFTTHHQMKRLDGGQRKLWLYQKQ